MQIRQSQVELRGSGPCSVRWKHEVCTVLLGLGNAAASGLFDQAPMMSVGAIKRELVKEWRNESLPSMGRVALHQVLNNVRLMTFSRSSRSQDLERDVALGLLIPGEPDG